jgi:hypothetical protein
VCRRRLYDGQIFLFTPTAETIALRDFARTMLEEAFAPLDPVQAQHELPVESFVEIFGPLKPKFIHHPKTKELTRAVVAGLGADLDDTYLDVPRLRGVTSDGYLTAGVGYAHPLHRDTWWSAPLAQLNWWLPLHEFESDSSMSFHPRYWSEGVVNHSDEFNYYHWNAVGRHEAAKHINSDTRKQPHPPDDIELDPQVRFVVPSGGIVLFSGAQMHATVANTSGRTRYSIDFRTVNAADLRDHRSAPNVDSEPEGTSLRDFRRLSDGAPLPDELVAEYDSGEVPDDAVLVFQPDDETIRS